MLRSFEGSLSFENGSEGLCGSGDWEDGGDSAYVERVLEREERMKVRVYRDEEDVGDGCCITIREVESDCIWKIHGGV
jgi:hypothetical protein